MNPFYTERRLKKRREFLNIACPKSYIVCDTCIVQYAKRDMRHLEHAVGIGFTVSKKVGNAVVRNRVKRRLREVVRLFFKEGSAQMASLTHFGAYDYVLIGRKAGYSATFSKMQDDFVYALHKIERRHLKQGTE